MAKSKNIYVSEEKGSDKKLLTMLESDGWHIEGQYGFSGAFVMHGKIVAQKEGRRLLLDSFEAYGSVTYELKNSKSNIKLLEKYGILYSEIDPWDEEECND